MFAQDMIPSSPSFRRLVSASACIGCGVLLLATARGQAHSLFSESFEGVEYKVGTSVEGAGGWRITASNPSLDDRAAMIRAGDAAGGSKALEVTVKGSAPSDSTRVVNDFNAMPLDLRAGKIYRITGAINYLNLDDLKASGGLLIRFHTDCGEFAFSLNAKKRNALLHRRVRGMRVSESLESDGDLIKPGQWYLFTLDLHLTKEGAKLDAALSAVRGGVHDKAMLWQANDFELGFSPSQVRKIEIAADRVNPAEALRVGLFDAIAISEQPSS